MRFRTVRQALYRHWDMQWILYTRRYAGCVWVRLPGLLRYFTVEDIARFECDDTLLHRWERAVSPLRNRRPAYVYLESAKYPSLNQPGKTTHEQLRLDETLLREWPRALYFAYRLQPMLRLLANESTKPLCIHAEDWSARWLLDTGIRPALLLLDNPFVTVDQLYEHYPAYLDTPTIVRRSALDLSPRRLEYWQFPHRLEQLLGRNLPEVGSHACWKYAPKLPAARPMREWLVDHPDFRPYGLPVL